MSHHPHKSSAPSPSTTNQTKPNQTSPLKQRSFVRYASPLQAHPPKEDEPYTTTAQGEESGQPPGRKKHYTTMMVGEETGQPPGRQKHYTTMMVGEESGQPPSNPPSKKHYTTLAVGEESSQSATPPHSPAQGFFADLRRWFDGSRR